MVSKWLTIVWTIISGGFLAMATLYPTETRSLISSTLGISNEIFVFYVFLILTTLAFGSFAVVLVTNIAKHFGWRKESILEESASQEKHNLTVKFPSQKRISWLSRLGRFSVKKENRAKFWTTVTIPMGIFGPIIIYIALSFPSALLPPEAILTFLIIKITMIGSGILMISLFAWFSTSEVYAMWKSRKQVITNRKTTYLNLIKNFDDSFRHLKDTTEPTVKATMFDDFQNHLHNLCYDLDWNDEIRTRIQQVLDYIPKKLSDDSGISYYLEISQSDNFRANP